MVLTKEAQTSSLSVATGKSYINPCNKITYMFSVVFFSTTDCLYFYKSLFTKFDVGLEYLPLVCTLAPSIYDFRATNDCFDTISPKSSVLK